MDTVAKSDFEQAVLEIAESILKAHGFRVVDLDCRIAGRGLVRVFIERDTVSPEPPTLDECAAMSPLLGDALENSGRFSGSYDLEVSSPGLDRRLRVMSDFDRHVGSEVKLKLVEKWENGGLNFTGQLEGTEAGRLHLKVGRESFQIPLSKVKQANLVWKPKEA